MLGRREEPMPNEPLSSHRALLQGYLCISALLLVGFLVSLGLTALGWRRDGVRELALDVLRAELAVSVVFGVIVLSAGLLMLRDAVRRKRSGPDPEDRR